MKEQIGIIQRIQETFKFKHLLRQNEHKSKAIVKVGNSYQLLADESEAEEDVIVNSHIKL